MRLLTRHQFWILLALAERPQQAGGVRSVVRNISNYQILLPRNSVYSALQGLVAARLIEPCYDLRYAWENRRPGQTYQLTASGQQQLRREILLEQTVLRWARRLDAP